MTRLLQPKCTISGAINLFTFIILLLIYNTTNAQLVIDSSSCSHGTGANPLFQNNKCRQQTDGQLSQTALERITALGTQAGWKQKYRSLMVGGKINGKGNFLINVKVGNQYSFDPNAPGSRLGIDGDGNTPKDCIYEREDEFLQWVTEQQFDEIVLYGIADILSIGQKIADDYYPSANSNEPFMNEMEEIQVFEWHLARFIRKAKNEYNLKVVSIIDRNNIGNTNKFYTYQNQYSKRSSLDESIANLSEEFINRYINLWIDNPHEVSYVDYGEDTLFFPKDSLGRISDIDKFITDNYNMAVYHFRASSGFIRSTENSCTQLPQTDNTCSMVFDAYMLEWEWWNHNSLSTLDSEFEDFKDYSRALRNGLFSLNLTCVPEIYAFQNDFGNDNVYTGQQRADTVDKLFDRIYLYAYRKNPCDCYNGPSGGLERKKFKNMANQLANNSYGAHNGRTVIVPTFNAKYYDSLKIFVDPYTEYYDDGNFGCEDKDTNNVIEVKECDYCQNYSGQFLNSLVGELDGNGNVLDSDLGYVENIFQDQYDFHSQNFSNESQSNIIYGYGWFKFSTMYDNDFVNSIDELSASNESSIVQLYPNPSSTFINFSSESLMHLIEVFDLKASFVQRYFVDDREISIEIPEKWNGLYLIQITTDSGKETQKILVE